MQRVGPYGSDQQLPNVGGKKDITIFLEPHRVSLMGL